MKPWKTKTTKIAYQNPFFTVHEDDVVRPDGTESKYYVVDRYDPFSIIIPVTPDNKTYLVEQYRYPIGKSSIEFPMGAVKGLDPLTMAKRELIEETGLRSRVWKDLGFYYLANGHSNQKAYVYAAYDLTQGKAEPEPGEFLKISIVSLDQIPEMIKKGIITDGPTITAWQLFELKNK